MSVTKNERLKGQNKIVDMHNSHQPLYLDCFMSGGVWYIYTLFSSQVMKQICTFGFNSITTVIFSLKSQMSFSKMIMAL